MTSIAELISAKRISIALPGQQISTNKIFRKFASYKMMCCSSSRYVSSKCNREKLLSIIKLFRTLIKALANLMIKKAEKPELIKNCGLSKILIITKPSYISNILMMSSVWLF